MGYHYRNPKVTGFDVRKPAILVYIHRGATWQLGALEWVFPKMPAKPPIHGARYGVFGAACHYVDGTFRFADAQDTCAQTSPQTAPSSASGTRRSSRSTSGSGTPTRRGSTRARTRSSRRSIAAETGGVRPGRTPPYGLTVPDLRDRMCHGMILRLLPGCSQIMGP